MSQQSSFNASSHELMRHPSLSQVNFQVNKQKIQSFRNNVSNGAPIIENVYQYQSSLPRTGLAGLRLSKRGSEISSTNDNFFVPAVKLENTYKLGPEHNQKFNPLKVQKVVYDILEELFENFKYDPIKSKEYVKSVSDEIKGKIKPMIFRRYKIIVNLTIGQNLGQNVMISSRSIWNMETDNSCTVEYKNKTMFVIATVFATYFE